MELLSFFHASYEQAFALECAARKIAREQMGLKNIKVMVPFVRTTQEASRVLLLMQKYGLRSGVDGLEIIMMCEIPQTCCWVDE